MAARRVIGELLWCPARGGYDLSRLGPSASPLLLEFFGPEPAAAQQAAAGEEAAEVARGRRWCEACARLRAPGIVHLSGKGAGRCAH
jgi:hypothetical protein